MLLYFVLAYAVTWSVWLAARAAPAGGPRGVLLLLGTFAPGLIALGLTARRAGRPGVVVLLRRLVAWEVPGRWFVFALAYIAAIKLTAAGLHRLVTGTWPAFGAMPWYLMLGATLLSTFVGGQTGEELGWRGYALPRLTARFGLGRASLLLGALWASWHLPLFLFLPEADTFGQSFPLYLLQVMALSVAIAWLFASTRGSLLPVMLLHAAVNNTKDIVPSAEAGATNPWALSHSLVAWFTVALLWLCAGYFLVRMHRDPALARAVTAVAGD